MNIMKEQFDRIAREGIIKDIMSKMGGKVSELEARVMVELNVRANDILDKKKQKVVQAVLDGEKIGMDTIINEIKSGVEEAIKQMEDMYRKSNDWEAYGFTMWVKGSIGIR